MIKPKGTPKAVPTSFSADADLLKRLDDEMWTRRIRNRSEMIRKLIEEALYRAGRLRAQGKPVELDPDKRETPK